MSSGLTEEIRRNNWEFLLHKLQHNETHQAVVNKVRELSDVELLWLLRYHDIPVTDPEEIAFRSRMDSWLGQAGLIYLGWLGGYITDPGAAAEAAMLGEILANPAVRRYYEKHYPVALPWLFRLHLEGSVTLPGESSMAGAGAFERFSILYERFRDDQDLTLFLNLLDGFWYGRTSIDTVVASFQVPDRVAEALARPADQITYLDRGISGMVRFLTFCHDLDQLLVLCQGMPLVQSAFWFFYAYWFHEYSVDVAEKSMAALDKVINVAESTGVDSTAERQKWQLVLNHLTSGESAKSLVAAVELAATTENRDIANWLECFRPYTRAVKTAAFIVAAPEDDVPPPDAERIVQCRKAIRRMYTAQVFGEKLAPAIHHQWRAHLPDHQRGGLYDRPYHELDPEGKAANMASAVRIPEILALVSCALEFGESTPEEETTLANLLERNMELLAEAEHEAWMEERFLRGWSYGAQRDNNARQHPLLVPYANLPEFEKDKDRRTIRQYPSYARLAGLKIVAKPE